MKKKLQAKKAGWLVAVIAVMAVIQVQAADMAAASGLLAEVDAMAVQAKTELANAAGAGDMAAIAEAAKRAAGVDAANAEAQSAYTALEKAVQDGDDAAASAAEEALSAAHQKAQDALNGNAAPATSTPENPSYDQWKTSKTNMGGGPGLGFPGYPLPNIYDVPWQTDGLRTSYASLFGGFWSASGSMDYDYAEVDATEI